MLQYCTPVIWLAITGLVIFLKGKTEEKKKQKKGFYGFFFFIIVH